MLAGSTLLRQLSRRDSSTSSRRSWSKRVPHCLSEDQTLEEEGYIIDGSDWDSDNGVVNLRKKVIVVVDSSREAKIAMLWALSHVINKFDTLTLLHVIENNKPLLPGKSNCKPHRTRPDANGCDLANSLRSLCKARRPEVEIEAVAVEGEKAATIVSQAKKLEASLLILGQRKPSLFQRFFRSKKDELIDYCIDNAQCLTLAVRKQSSTVGGYLINSRWHKNFWLLA
eukprot:Gb_33732 [translate_table: standard]